MNPLQHAFCQIRPMFENAWTRVKLGAFVNRLASDLPADYAKLQAHLATLPDKGLEFCRQDNLQIDTDDLVTAHDFVVLLFNLRPNEIHGRQGEPAVDKILDIVEEAEEHLLHHVARCTNTRAKLLEPAGAYKLVMSQIQSTHKNRAGKFPNFKNKALFTISDFVTELDAAGVPPFYCQVPQDDEKDRIYNLYKQLPTVVKEMFFASSFHGKLRNDIPLYIVRDFILFADDARWAKLKDACEKGKQEGTQEFADFLCDFLDFERNLNNVSLGAARKTRDRDPKNFNPREQAYLEICRPYKWLGKVWRENSTQKKKEP